MPRRCIWAAAGMALAIAVLQADRIVADDSKHRAQLEAHGVAPTADGLHRLFSEVTSEPNDQSLILWIDKLGSPSYAERSEAQQFLMRQSQLPLDRLRAAAESSNPEVAYRASTILRNWIPGRERLIESALWFVGEERIGGLTNDVIKIATAFRDRDKITRAAEHALVGTAQPAELDLLISHVEGHDPLLAHLALAACLALDTFEQPDRMLRWGSRTELSDLDRLKSVLALARANDKRALPALVALLGVQDRAVATRANIALRGLTGHKVILSPTDPESTAEARRQWTEWLARSPDSFEMRLGDLQLNTRRSNLNGNTLLALGYKNRVVELNPNGEEVWSFDALGVWSAEKTESGDILLACYQENKVKLVSPQKTVLWEYEIPGVLKAHALDNGNILAAAHSANKVVEISPEKKVVWEFSADTQCHDAARLENGNTLVCTANELLEIDAGGTAIWRFPAEQAYGIDLLPDGNVLVAKLGGEVIEVDRGSNAIVWTYQFASPVDVYRTDDGTTLITGAQTVVELDADKNIMWTKDICNFGSARK